MTPEDPSIVSPSVQPALGAITWAADGSGRAKAIGDPAVAPGCDPSVTVAATSTYIGGVKTGYVMPTTVGATRAVDSAVRPAFGSGIAVVTDCSVTSEGAP